MITETTVYNACKNDIIYFANNHIFITKNKNTYKLQLTESDIQLLLHYNETRNIPDYIHAIYAVWNILFYSDKKICVYGKTPDILNLCYNIIENIPDFLRPQIIKLSNKHIALANRSDIQYCYRSIV